LPKVEPEKTDQLDIRKKNVTREWKQKGSHGTEKTQRGNSKPSQVKLDRH